MKKVYYLSTCDTCQRIMDQVDGIADFEHIDIKSHGVVEADLDRAADVVGSYEAVFSKRARKYRSQGLHEKNLSEADFKNLILKEYTFLKRPVFFVDEAVFVGNSKKVVEALIQKTNG